MNHLDVKPGNFSPETDIYALGATFFNLLTGLTPPSASDIYEDGIPVKELESKGVSRKAISVICQVMAGRKKDRLKNAQAFINALSKSNKANQDSAKHLTPKANAQKPEKNVTFLKNKSIWFFFVCILLFLLSSYSIEWYNPFYAIFINRFRELPGEPCGHCGLRLVLDE